VVRGFIAHPGVHDDATVVGQDHVGGGGSARAIDQPVDDGIRGIVVDRCEQLFARSSVDEMVDLLLDVHLTSICTGKAFI
jgi:hypothetical protein